MFYALNQHLADEAMRLLHTEEKVQVLSPIDGRILNIEPLQIIFSLPNVLEKLNVFFSSEELKLINKMIIEAQNIIREQPGNNKIPESILDEMVADNQAMGLYS